MESTTVGALETWVHTRRNDDMNIVMNHSEFRGESEPEDGNRARLTAARR